MPEDKKESGGSGLSLQTLLISALAAATAATVVPMFWEQGTIFATAMTPVIVALVSEGLRKPVQTVGAVAPRVARRSGTGAAVRRFDPAAARTRRPERVGARGEGPERFDPLPPHRRGDAPALRSDDPYGLRGAERRRRPRLKIALITAALAFVIAAGVVTASELALFGGSVGSDRRTSLFGGQQKERTSQDERDEEASPTATPDAEATPSPEATAAPPEEATPAPTATPEATPTPAPTEAAPVPTATP
jgi:hypothetical protein